MNQKRHGRLIATTAHELGITERELTTALLKKVMPTQDLRAAEDPTRKQDLDSSPTPPHPTYTDEDFA